MRRSRLILLCAAFLSLCSRTAPAGDDGVPPLRLAIVGLVHGHVEGALWNARERDDIEIVGVYDPSPHNFDRFADKYGLDKGLYFNDLGKMLDATRPDAASVMTSIADHVVAARECLPRRVPMLVEKPLAYTNEDAGEIARLSREHRTLVLTNYETSWYASVRTAARMAKETGPINRAVFRHGHKGPIEIGCSDIFLDWLTDPARNGGGALIDFGCYGADIMTWLMDGRAPDSVYATAQSLKPDLYPAVDDDATIVLTYDARTEPGLPSVPGATAVVQASWAWTHDNKDADLFTPGASYHCKKWDDLSVRAPDGPAEPHAVDDRPAWLRDEWTYLRYVVRGACPVDPLSSLETNLVVVSILDAARESARTGCAVRPEVPASD